jgi:hypothetical protein
MNILKKLGQLGQKSWDLGRSIVDQVTGQNAKDAAREAAAVQKEAGLAAIEEARAARETARTDLMPYAQFGQQQLPALSSILNPQGQVDYLQNNPIFKASLANMNEQVLNNAAVRGRLNAGDTRQRFLENFQASALPLLSYQTNSLFNAANLGQSSAAGQAANGLNASQVIGSNITGIGNANAAGIVGVQNARNQATKDILGGITSIYGMI